MAEWWRTGVFYEIYVRSFQDSNGDGVGDLEGILQHLDYLNDGTPSSLGVDALWLTPIYPSPMRDFGYDVANYCEVHPLFGDLRTFDRLVEEAHRRNIRIILDFVPNHTSSEHPWFLESRRSRTNPKRSWYVWRDPKPDGSPPNNWVSSFGGPAWTLEPATGQYYLHSFLPEQPDLNWRNPEVVSAMEDVLRFWLDRGVDGFRIDVIHKLVKDAALRDNPKPPPEEEHPVYHFGGQVHLYDEDQPEVHDIIRRWRQLLDRYGSRMMVGEVYLFDAQRIARYYGSGQDELHLAFNFRFLWSPWDAGSFRHEVETMEALLPRGAQPTYVLSSHDAPRHRTRFDHPEYGDARARVAALMLLTLRGTPFIYYGEEIGMRDVPIPPERICDPVGQRFPGLGRDPERTPMQWSGAAYAGFSSVEPWLPVASDFADCNVEKQRHDPASLLSFYRKLIWKRKQSPALQRGSYSTLDAPEHVFAYERAHAEQTLVVVLNFGTQPTALTLPHAGTLWLSTSPQRRDAGPKQQWELDANEGIVVELKRGGSTASR
ncbi:MAG: alpha-amylase family glycosyl hydrolase [Candidatus Binatia bacterium]|nr:alpha-amylase family glycosyl hydrolase [Candidatus Binatia bacterium]